METVSIIVPFRNVERYFSTLLRSLLTQEFEGPLEIILIDNCSTDGSRRIAEDELSHDPRVRIVDAPDRANGSYARNVGVSKATGDKLLFVDSDDAIAPGYVAAMAEALDAHDFVTSAVECRSLNPEWVQEAHGPVWQESSVPTAFDFMLATGANVGIRRRVFDSARGFPEAFSGSQDLAFSWNVQLAGARVHFVPAAIYSYRHRDSLWRLFRQTVNWGSSNVLLFRSFRALGMPPRQLSVAAREWREVVIGLFRARTRAERAALIVRLGYCVGRVKGSIRYGTIYL